MHENYGMMAHINVSYMSYLKMCVLRQYHVICERDKESEVIYCQYMHISINDRLQQTNSCSFNIFFLNKNITSTLTLS